MENIYIFVPDVDESLPDLELEPLVKHPNPEYMVKQISTIRSCYADESSQTRRFLTLANWITG